MGHVLHRHRTIITIVVGALLMLTAVLTASATGDDSKDRGGDRGADLGTNTGMATAGPDIDHLLELRDRFIAGVARELDEDPDRVQGAVRTGVVRWLDRWTDRGMLSRGQAEVLLDCWDGKRCSPAALLARP